MRLPYMKVAVRDELTELHISPRGAAAPVINHLTGDGMRGNSLVATHETLRSVITKLLDNASLLPLCNVFTRLQLHI